MRYSYIKMSNLSISEIKLSKADLLNEDLQKHLEYLFQINGIPDVILKRKKVKQSLNLYNIKNSNYPIKKIIMTDKGVKNHLLQRKLIEIFDQYSHYYKKDPDFKKVKAKAARIS